MLAYGIFLSFFLMDKAEQTVLWRICLTSSLISPMIGGVFNLTFLVRQIAIMVLFITLTNVLFADVLSVNPDGFPLPKQAHRQTR